MGDDEDIFYFGYGSLVNPIARERRGVETEEAVAALLPNYELTFSYGGAANLVEKEGAWVYGIAMKCASRKDWDLLKDFDSGYDNVAVQVFPLNQPDDDKDGDDQGAEDTMEGSTAIVQDTGKPIRARVFVLPKSKLQNSPDPTKIPQERYLKVIASGLRVYGVDEFYIQEKILGVPQIPSRKPDNYLTFPNADPSHELPSISLQAWQNEFQKRASSKAAKDDDLLLFRLGEHAIKVLDPNPENPFCVWVKSKMVGPQDSTWVIVQTLYDPDLPLIPSPQDVTSLHQTWAENQMVEKFAQAGVQAATIYKVEESRNAQVGGLEGISSHSASTQPILKRPSGAAVATNSKMTQSLLQPPPGTAAAATNSTNTQQPLVKGTIHRLEEKYASLQQSAVTVNRRMDFLLSDRKESSRTVDTFGAESFDVGALVRQRLSEERPFHSQSLPESILRKSLTLRDINSCNPGTAGQSMGSDGFVKPGAQELSTLYTDCAQISTGDTSLVKGQQQLNLGALAVTSRPGGESNSLVPFGALPDSMSALSEEQESNQNNNNPMVEAELVNETVHTATNITESEREVGAQLRAMDESSVDSRNQSIVEDTKSSPPVEQEAQPEEKRYPDPRRRCLLGLAAFALMLASAVLGAVIWSSSQDQTGFEPEEDAASLMAVPGSLSKDYPITAPPTNPMDPIPAPKDELVNDNPLESEQDSTQTAAIPGAHNDECENAKPLPLDPDILQIQVSVHSFSLTTDPEAVSSECAYYGGGFDSRPGVWYSLIGNGRKYQIEVEGNEGPSVAVYDGVFGCNSLQCNFYDQSEESHWFYDGVTLPTKEGENYLIFVYHSKGEFANTVMTVSQYLG